VLTTRAPGKVNVCLLVGAPRADGLHPLVSIFQPLTLADELTLTAGAGADTVVCPGVESDNLAARALAEFRRQTGWDGAPRTLTIAKHVPVAAGMGGGSADAAAALRLAATASGLPIPPDLPMRLGADVPVLLNPRRALVTGAGEDVEPLPLAPSAGLVIVPLDAELSTAAVYREFDARDRPRSPEELEEAATALRTGGVIPIVNDLEAAAKRLCAAIEPALEALRRAGVRDPMVTGSGPTVFGYSDDPEAPQRLRAAGYPRATAVEPV
jgi:4-diphosphocytidyl-2-C-methyl-D-erythritol kinase